LIKTGFMNEQDKREENWKKSGRKRVTGLIFP